MFYTSQDAVTSPNRTPTMASFSLMIMLMQVHGSKETGGAKILRGDGVIAARNLSSEEPI